MAACRSQYTLDRPRHVLLVFVDGIGLPDSPVRNSIYAPFPFLARLLTEHSTALDAGLSVPGTPQSATGQAAILTGINAAKCLGAHRQGFPNPSLRTLIERENIFVKLARHGHTSTFANAYIRCPGSQLPHVLRSATTVATLAAFGQTRNRRELLAGKAVYHDVTRETLPTHGITDIPTISEDLAAAHLMAVAHAVDFCLFEYFLTDHAGHRDRLEEKNRALGVLDRLLKALARRLDPTHELLLLISDHGNIEQAGVGHTKNRVPLAAWGQGAEALRTACRSLTDLTPGLLHLLSRPPNTP